MPETIDPDSQTVQQSAESGLRFNRVWMTREAEEGVTPTDPDWMFYSDLLLEFEAGIDPAIEGVNGLGTPDPDHFSGTVEENEIMIAYALQRELVDTNGYPVDPAADAMLRNLANQIPNTHSMVARDEVLAPGPQDPEGCEGQRMYLVMKGGKADLAMEPDATEAQPTPVELTYTPVKARSYHIYQPGSSSLLCVKSTNANDTNQMILIEDEGANTTEQIALDGTTLVSGSTEFTDIDAIELDSEAEGEVEVFINTGSESTPTEGGKLATLHGAEFYAKDDGTVEGDLGVPTLEAGTSPSAIDQGYEDFYGDRVERPAGARIAPDLNNISLEIDNNLEPQPKQSGTGVRVHEGNRNVTITSNVIGEKVSHDLIEDAMAEKGLDMEWELSRSLITLPNATVTGPPPRTRTGDEAFAEIEVEMQSEGIQITQTT